MLTLAESGSGSYSDLDVCHLMRHAGACAECGRRCGWVFSGGLHCTAGA